MERLLDSEKRDLDFPHGTVDKNPPANAGDMGSIPGLRRFHLPQSNETLWATATEPELTGSQATTAEACAP